ncbi:DNA repair and recombination protein RadB [Methanothrix sp.]|uniref:DNA repair and recombination protein RadB n=1 Tax=Methanothrix sp. TaxID=90426 RepID=UPI0034E2D252
MIKRIPSGCKSIDELLGGGFEAGIITQIYGESGTGKTNIVIQLSVQTVKLGSRVIFIDTEGFSPDRFVQIAGENAKEIASKIVVFQPLSLEQQHMAIRDASRIVGQGFGLVVLDSATSLYRAALEANDNRQIKRSLTAQLSELQEIARRHSMPVVITNQVYMDVDTGVLRPVGGTSMEHLCKAILALERLGEGRRRMRVVKHRSQPEGEAADFLITSSGLV